MSDTVMYEKVTIKRERDYNRMRELSNTLSTGSENNKFLKMLKDSASRTS